MKNKKREIFKISITGYVDETGKNYRAASTLETGSEFEALHEAFKDLGYEDIFFAAVDELLDGCLSKNNAANAKKPTELQ